MQGEGRKSGKEKQIERRIREGEKLRVRGSDIALESKHTQIRTQINKHTRACKI